MSNRVKRVILVLLILGFYISVGKSSDTINQEVKAANGYGELTVTFLDVGQGDCILLQSQGQTMLIDAGKSEYGDYVVDYLREQGITRLNYAVITHDHADHIGGFHSVLPNISIGKLLRTGTRYNDETICKTVNSMISSMNIPIGVPVVGSTMQLGSATIEFIAPNGSGYSSYNDTSIVMRVVNGQNSFLLTSDAEAVSEKEMLKSGRNLKADVLKVCHHSALTSSTQEFIDAVSPSISVITCDEAGAAGFPRLGTLAKLTASNIYRTDISGAITFTSDGTTITTEQEPYFYANSYFDKSNGDIERTLEEESLTLHNVKVTSECEEIELHKITEDEEYTLLLTEPITMTFSAECGISSLDSIEYCLVKAEEEQDIDDMDWIEAINGEVTVKKDFVGCVWVKFENGLGNMVVRKTTGFALDYTAPTKCTVSTNVSNLRLVSQNAVNTYERYTYNDSYPLFEFSCNYGASGAGNIEYMLVNRGDDFDIQGEWTKGEVVELIDDFIGRIYVRFTDGAGNQIIKKTQGFTWIDGAPTNLWFTSNVEGIKLLTLSKNTKRCTAGKAVSLSFSADFGHGGKKVIQYQIVKRGKTYYPSKNWVSKESLTLPKGFAGRVYIRFIDKAGNVTVRKTNYIRIPKKS